MTPVFALTLVVLLGTAGMAVDYSRIESVRSRVQSGVDAAVLATAKSVVQNPDIDTGAVFNKYMASQPHPLHGAKVTLVSLDKSGSELAATVAVDLPLVLLPILGFNDAKFNVLGAAEYGIGEMEIILSLDTTGSMAGTKIDALKASAHLLVDALAAAAPSPEKLRVGLVPFAKYVNVGMGNRNASWINVPADYTTTEEKCDWEHPVISQSNCRTVNDTCANDGVSYACSYETCDYVYGESVYSCETDVDEVEWNGCVYSRSYPLNVKDEDYATRIPGKMDSSCSEPITPLSSDLDVVKSAIDAMSADGDTYIPEGLMWGWRLLSPIEPFDQSKSGSDSSVRRFLVLMTDGVNSVSPSTRGHHDDDIEYANQLTQEACANIKADGITIFTVAFEVSDPTTKDILHACASSSKGYFDATDSKGLAEAFQAIGNQLADLRLTK